MTASPTPSEAARALSQMRWGTRRLDRMIGELHDRADELGAEQVAELSELVEQANEKESA